MRIPVLRLGGHCHIRELLRLSPQIIGVDGREEGDTQLDFVLDIELEQALGRCVIEQRLVDYWGPARLAHPVVRLAVNGHEALHA